ncbi:MAG: SPOR domain-containing protein [Bacteroidota bacterium]
MRVEQFIAELLYRYNCVVVPEFGAFLANTTSARINDKQQTLHPPTKSLSFNQQLIKNDGLLVSHIANVKNLPYEELLEEVIEVSNQWKVKLESGKSLLLEGIGKLWLGKEGKIQFFPEEGHNYLASSFGFSSFNAAPVIREKLKEEAERLEEKVPFTFTPENRGAANHRHWLKYAAVFLLLLSTGASGYQFYNQNQQKQLLVQQNVQEQISKHIQEATFFEGNPVELPALSLNISKKMEGPMHHIIAGAFRFKDNADKKIAQLKAQGYNASYLGPNRSGLHQVTFDSFSDSQEALTYLRKIKATISSDAWMLSER